MAINFDKLPAYIKAEVAGVGVPVKKGSRGKAVKRVQEWLQIHNYPTAIDEDYGPATASRVKDFQTSVGISQTGTVNI